jgi:hypothetical protein
MIIPSILPGGRTHGGELHVDVEQTIERTFFTGLGDLS